MSQIFSNIPIILLGLFSVICSANTLSEWSAFNKENGSLPDNYIHDISIFQGKTRISTLHGVFETTYPEMALRQATGNLAGNFVMSFRGSSAGDIWAFSPTVGVTLLSSAGESFYGNSAIGFQSEVIIGFDANNDLAVATGNKGGVFVFHNKSWHPLHDSEMKSENCPINTVKINPGNGVIAVSCNDDILIYSDKKWLKFKPSEHNLPLGGASLFEFGSDTSLWVTFNFGGVAVFDRGKWSRLFFPDNNVSLLKIINSGGIYVGVDDEGLYRYRKDGNWTLINLSMNAVKTDTENKPIVGNPIELLESLDEELWVATDTGNVGKIIRDTAELQSLGTPINTLKQTNDNELWAGTNSGLYRFTNGEWHSVEYTGIKDADVTIILETLNSEKLIGTVNSGLFVYRPAKYILEIDPARSVGALTYLMLKQNGLNVIDRDARLSYSTSADGRLWSKTQVLGIDNDGRWSVPAPENTPERFYLRAFAIDKYGQSHTFAEGDLPVYIKKPTTPLRIGAMITSVLGGLELVIWITLIYMYGRSRKVQMFLFWSPSNRKIFSFGLIDVLIAFSERFRRYLLSPWIQQLRCETEGTQDEKYYMNLKGVIAGEEDSPFLLSEIDKKINTPLILIGKSGSGKTFAAKHFAAMCDSPVAYVQARHCAAGVTTVISESILLPSKDVALIEKMIAYRTLIVVIDGLNEVDATTLSRITDFAKKFSNGKILLTTQPIRWTAPSGYIVANILPLSLEESIKYIRVKAACNSKNAIEIENFISDYSNSQLRGFDESSQDNLSTPFDLDLVVQLIEIGEQPTHYSLQQQHFEAVKRLFKSVFSNPLPVALLSSAAYSSRLAGSMEVKANLPKDYFEFLVDEKLLLKKTSLDPVFVFRHERVQDFLISLHFLDNPSEILEEHLADARFSGVFNIIAGKLEPAQASKLLNEIAIRSSETREVRVLDAFVEKLKKFDCA